MLTPSWNPELEFLKTFAKHPDVRDLWQLNSVSWRLLLGIWRGVLQKCILFFHLFRFSGSSNFCWLDIFSQFFWCYLSSERFCWNSIALLILLLWTHQIFTAIFDPWSVKKFLTPSFSQLLFLFYKLSLMVSGGLIVLLGNPKENPLPHFVFWRHLMAFEFRYFFMHFDIYWVLLSSYSANFLSRIEILNSMNFYFDWNFGRLWWSRRWHKKNPQATDVGLRFETWCLFFFWRK